MRPANTDPLATTRRGFLRLASASASLASLACLRPLPASAVSAATTASVPFFDPGLREVLRHVVIRMVDAGDAGAPAVDDVGALDTIDTLCRGLDPELVSPLRIALRLVEWGPFVFDRRLSRFSQLSPERQDASLTGWMTSRFEVRRLVFYALRNLAMIGYYSQPQTWSSIDYRGPLLSGDGGPS